MANVRTSRRSGFIIRNGVQRRESVWIGLVATDTGLGAATTPVLFSGYSAAALALRPFTIVRTRGWFSIRSDQEGADETYAASLAMAIVSDQALAIGVTAVPTAVTNRESDLFFLYEELSGNFVFVSGLTAFESAPGTKFDSKAMRKVEVGQDIAVTIESPAVSNGVAVYKAGRQLVKLH